MRPLVHVTWRAVRRATPWRFFSRAIPYSPPSFVIDSTTQHSSQPLNEPDGDDAMFEDPSDDYDLISQTSHISAVENLVNLVKSGRFDLAEQVRAEMSSAGVKIQPSPIFARVLEGMMTHETRTRAELVKDIDAWFALMPNADNADPQLLDGAWGNISVAVEENLTLALRFGKVCAEKGYFSLLVDEVVPAVTRHVDFGILQQFLRELESLGGEYLQKMQKDAGDMDIPFSPSVLHARLIMAAVDQTLPEKLPKPTPHSSAVFEYDGLGHELSTIPNVLQSQSLSIQRLESLLEDGKYDDAYILLKDLQALGTPIPPSPLYIAAASAVLHRDYSDPYEEILPRFIAWLSLIPPAKLAQPNVDFRLIQHRIVNEVAGRVPLLMNMGIILASKGYTDLALQGAVRYLLQMTSPEEFLPFFREFESATESYYRNYSPALLRQAEILMRRARGTTIAAWSRAGYLDHVLRLLPDPKTSTFCLTTHTYDRVLHALYNSNDPRHRMQISYVTALRDNDATSIPSIYRTIDRMPVEEDILAMLGEYDPMIPPEAQESLPMLLRWINLRLRNNLRAHPQIIAAFITDYIQTTGRTKAVELLRKAAYRAGAIAAKKFLLGEMLYYHRQERNDLVIQTFVDHFMLAGVPRAEILKSYRLQQLRQKYACAQLPPRIPSDARYGLRKLWPNHTHCNLTWQALADVASNISDVERLYAKLVEIAKHGHSTESEQMLLRAGVFGQESLQETLHIRPGPSAFTPFIRPLMQHFGAVRGTMILKDMIDAGVQPSVYQLTELAGGFARAGDPRRALLTLDRLEQVNKEDGSKEKGCASLLPWRRNPLQYHEKHAATEADLVIYISIMRGCLLSHNIAAAKEVERRLKLRHVHVPGEYEHLDIVLADLEAMEERMARYGDPTYVEQ